VKDGWGGKEEMKNGERQKTLELFIWSFEDLSGTIDLDLFI